MSCLFDKEIYIFGIRRGGIHAIQTWLIKKYTAGEYICQNNTRFTLMDDKLYPIEIKKKNYKVYLNIVEQEPLEFIRKQFQNTKSVINKQKRAACQSANCDCFSGSVHFILLLRNPFNNLASVFKLRDIRRSRRAVINATMTSTFKDRWIQYAEEYLGITSYLPSRCCILYDKWFASKDYRSLISNSLQVPVTDNVNNLGKGRWASSFDRRKYDGKAQKMDVLNRWKHYKNNEEYNLILSDDKLRDMYIRIWDSFPY